MKKIVFGTASIMLVVLWLSGCAFDKFRMSIDNGTLYKDGIGTNNPTRISTLPTI